MDDRRGATDRKREFLNADFTDFFGHEKAQKYEEKLTTNEHPPLARSRLTADE